MYFGLYPCFWQRAPKTLRISHMIKEIKLSFVIHNKPLSITLEFMLMR